MSSPHARNIVRKLLANKNALRVQELYIRGLSEYPATPFPPPPPPKEYIGRRGVPKPVPPQPPNPTHPFRSRSYLKDKVLPDLISTGEVEKFHSVVEATPGLTPSKKRITRSKAAQESGGLDIWKWRLTGPQAESSEPKLEDEPIPDSHDWYSPNQLFDTLEPKKKRGETRTDPYGAGRWDHLILGSRIRGLES
ncbi:hypothetical protein RhiXN_01963 [Rhizoctonia solani]|uniref:Uncharacterized protein n=1 Tax=Rhizoctonia solani TaxID=456999 RepID=A0A8H8PBY1_9AGAM|nr:uncharacterized protein RhiXN_01963 [Rhizoctonia solani]QRW27368.1 hypothetical protein RhiXN_01963 [Rhizoctonia solani]